MHLDGGVRRIHGHFLLNDHAVLNVFTTGIDLLAGDEAVQLGILGNTPDIGGQQHMGDAEVGQTFPALLTDIALNIRNFKGILKQIGAGVALNLEVGSDLCHGCKGADFSAIDAVTPCGMVGAVCVNTQCENHKENTQQHQKIRKHRKHGAESAFQQCCFEEIHNKSDGNQNNGKK